LADAYSTQLAIYAHAVHAATGVAPASLRLAFLAAGVEHTMAWDEAARAASTRAIDATIQQARSEADPPSA